MSRHAANLPDNLYVAPMDGLCYRPARDTGRRRLRITGSLFKNSGKYIESATHQRKGELGPGDATLKWG